MAQSQQLVAAAAEPAEAELLRDLLQTLGVKHYDPRVLDCLLDLTYRATSDILKDAEAINMAAGGSGASLAPQDVALAAAQHARLQPQPPSMQELLRLANLINKQPLTGPSDKQHGIKLPPAVDCLLSQNYQVKPRPRPAALPAPPAAAAPAAPRQQHLAVRQEHGRVSMALPAAGWQPPADAAQPSDQPAFQQRTQQQQQQQGAADGAAGAPAVAAAALPAAARMMAAAAAAAEGDGQQAMEVDGEEI